MEPRKSSDVLLDLESKIEVLLNLVRTQDLNIKILSNKINILSEKTNGSAGPTYAIQAAPPVPKPSIEAVDTKIIISPEDSLPLEKEPKGFRRTSRPETYSAENKMSLPKFPIQMPKTVEPEIMMPKVNEEFKEAPKEVISSSSNTIPIVQRIVDKNGKSVFLADVEIIELKEMKPVTKTRTNGAGKWMSSLPIGEYRIFIRKRESLSKEKLEVTQDIKVTGTESRMELQTMVIKS